jgi:hypothetical protein
MVTWTAIVISSAFRFVSMSSSLSLRSDIKEIRNRFFFLFLVCTFIVAIGVVLEELEFRTKKSYVDAESEAFIAERKIKFATLGLWLVVAGITGEGLFEMATSWVDDVSESFSNSLLLNAEALTGNAAKYATIAREQAEAVDRKAKDLQIRLDAASAQLSDVEQDTLAQGPRWRLLDLGRMEFIKSLRPFAKQKSTVVICGVGDSERMPFEQLLMDLLRKADWAAPGYKSWRGCPTMLSGGNEMFFVSASATRTQWLMPYGCTSKFSVPVTEDTAKAGKALCDVLIKLRISTMAWIEAPIHSLQTREQEIARASTFFSPLPLGAGNDPDNPAGLALKEPDTVFILVGPSQPIFNKRSRKETAPQ